ncbi:hypothetical protein PMI01_02256 [Caulobacter sp. AP07]|uniref:YDG domain-containing protein n=1 Tax=Caulobacter sp. AP07 TaxID=1144304 RepID=UPI0002722527|nr:YDG domain-containing protein [Caulobacter sp. AP07]EJL33293.1 hypothetical protein PMI01_02256 [Caulobacter sp. AP07]
MTPSPIRPILSRTASRPARRARLLAASALCGVAAMLAPPALAGTLPGIPSAANITVSSGGSQPTISFPDAITLQIELNAPRTVINWTDLHLSSGDAMNFIFDAADDIVLNKTTSQIRFDTGSVVTGKVGAATAGNVWFYSPQGVIVSPGATMTAGGFLFSRGSSLSDAGFVSAADPLANLRAATDALIKMTTISSATSASINSTGDVVLSASSGDLNVGIASGATVDISTTSGSITASEVTATTGAASVAAGGPGATVTSITGATGVSVSSGNNTSVGSATTTGVSGDITIQSGNVASLTTANSGRDLFLSAPMIFLDTAAAARDVFVTATTGGAMVTHQVFAGDDIEITATTGDVSAGGATLRSTGLGASDDAHVLARSTSGFVNVGAANTQGTGVAAGDVTIESTNSTILGAGGSTRDLTVTGSNPLSLTGAYSATGTASFTSTTGMVTQAGGSITAGLLTVDAASGVVLTQAGNNVTNLGIINSGTGGFSYHDLDSFGLTDAIVSGGDVSLTSGGAITQTAGTITADVLNVTAATGISLTEDNLVTSLGVVNNTTSGALAFRDADGFDITDNIDSAGNVSLFTTSGDITHSGGTLHAGGFFSLDAGGLIAVGDLSAGGGVGVIAAGSIEVTSATAGGGVSLLSNAGQAVLRKAVLTGSGASDNLSIVAAGDAILGSDSHLTITTDNVFSRTGGSTGTADVRSTSGDALVHLDSSAGFDTLEGAGVDVTIRTGPASFGAITANTGDLYVEALDGALSVGTATATAGDLDLLAHGGDLTITGSVHGGGRVHIETDGLLDGTAASLISSGGDLELFGGGVDVGHLQAGGALEAAAIDSNVLVQLAEAGQTVQVISLNGDATLRGGEGADGIAVVALNKATFGADDKASITAANSAITDPTCGCGSGGLQVLSSNGDAVVNINSASNGIALVGAGIAGTATVVQKTGDLKIEELAAYNITLEAMGGTLETGFTTTSGGDYTITAQDFLGDALTPTLFSGLIRDVTITDTLGGLNFGATAIHADRRLTITALNGGAVTGSGQLDAGLGAGAHDGEVNIAANAITLGVVRSDGDVGLSAGTGGVNLGAVVHADRLLGIIALNGAVTGAGQLDAGTGTTFGDIEVAANAIALDTIRANRDVNLNAGTGLVNVATSLSVDRTYALIGGDFSAAALTPLGAKAGTWTIMDQAGDFDFSGKTLHYGSSIAVNVFNGDVIGGDITSDAGTVFVQADGGSLGALYAGGGQVTAIGDVGGMAVASAQGVARITVTAANGTASLGSAVLTGPGIHGLTVRATNGDVVLGAATPGAITAGNVVTSTGSSLALVASTPTGKVDVNLDHMTNANLTTLSGPLGVTVQVINGPLRVGNASATGGQVWITGSNGAVTVDQLTAGGTSLVRGGGETRLVSANVTGGGGLSVLSTGAGVRLGDATPGRVIAVTNTLNLSAATDITQQGAIHAGGTGVNAGTGVTLLGDNQVRHLNWVNVAGGGFAFHGATAFDIVGPIVAVGQTVDLRSDQTIGQAPLGVITAQKLTGSSVGAAIFGLDNQIAELGDFTNTTGRLKLVSNRALTISGTVLSTGTLSIASHGGMTIAGTGTVRANGAGDAVVLASDGVFTNARGADAVTAASAGGRWLIYTQAFGDPQGSTAGNTFNGLVGKSFYGAPYDFAASGFTVGVNNGNRFVYAYQPTITVAPDSRTVTYSGAIPSLSATVTGLINGDLFTDAWLGALVISGATSKNVGTYTLNAVTGGLTSDLNYAFAAGPAGSLRIDPKALSGVLAATNKTYDGTVAASGSIGLTGLVAGDTVSASGTYAFADKNAGTGKTVTAAGVALSGADAGNYTLAPLATTQADILKKGLTGALAAANKTYDGTTAASGSIGLTGVVAGDTVNASGTYAFADKNAGTGKTVTVSAAALTGLDAANYDLGGVSGGLADILRRQVTVAADSAFKPFGAVDPTLTYRIAVGDLAAGDAFTGGLTRDPGEVPGGYGITRGTLGLSMNYDLTFTGAVFTIRPFPSSEAGGSMTLKHLVQSPDFTLDWDPEINLTTGGQACPGEGCPPQAAMSGSAGGRAVATLR